jgi:hypothetical protein
MRYPTTDTNFELYKMLVTKWLTKFGLANSYMVHFTHKPGDGTASVNGNTVGRFLRFNLCSSWRKPVTNEEIDRCAIHEVAHALLGQLIDLHRGSEDKTLAEYIERDEETVAVTLENFVMNEIVNRQ